MITNAETIKESTDIRDVLKSFGYDVDSKGKCACIRKEIIIGSLGKPNIDVLNYLSRSGGGRVTLTVSDIYKDFKL